LTLSIIVYILETMEGLTISEMSKKLSVLPRTVERRIQRAGIKPLSKEAVYPLNTLEKIKDVTMGRPKKAPADKGKYAKKPTKPKK